MRPQRKAENEHLEFHEWIIQCLLDGGRKPSLAIHSIWAYHRSDNYITEKYPSEHTFLYWMDRSQ